MVSPRSTQYRGSNGTEASVSWASLENVADKQVLYLTTVGRRTGLPREIEIWFVVWCERLYMFAETREAAGWVKNIWRKEMPTSSEKLFPSCTNKLGGSMLSIGAA